MKPLIVCTAVNDAYLLPLCVMLRSLGTTLSPNYVIDLRVLTLDLSANSKKILHKCVQSLPITIKFVQAEKNHFDGLKVNGHISVETYLRIFLERYLVDERFVLYLDADLVIRHSIHELYNLPFDDFILLAAPHICPKSAFYSAPRGLPSYQLLGLPSNGRTFNAGVMLLDLDRFRENTIADAVLNYLRRYSQQVLWWDQDGLNAVLHSRWGALPAKWNVMTSHFSQFTNWSDSLLDKSTFLQTLNNPAIIHFSSVPKPWEKEYIGLYKDEWERVFASISQFI